MHNIKDIEHIIITTKPIHIVKRISSYILNACTQHTYYPSTWKFGYTICLLKKSKIDKLLGNRMTGHLVTHHLLSKTQHGFRHHYQSITPALQLHSNNIYAYNNGKQSSSILRRTKSFSLNMARRTIMQLYLFGFRVLFIRLIQSFLTQRQMTIKFKDKYTHSH